MQKHVFGTSVQSDQGLYCLLTELLDTTECLNGDQRMIPSRKHAYIILATL